MERHVGCTGWSYKDWYGDFYDKKSEVKFKEQNKGKVYALNRYSRFFDCTEINSFNYTLTLEPTALDGIDLPHKAKWWFSKQMENHKRPASPYSMYERIGWMAQRWHDSVPDDFHFTTKLPGMITHAKCMRSCKKETDMFFEGMAPLKEKLKVVLLEFPSYVTKERFDDLRSYLSSLPKQYQYAVEFRSKDWQDKEVYEYLTEHGVSIVISDVRNKGVDTIKEHIDSSPFTYMRIIGKHGVFNRFDHMRRTDEMEASLKGWARVLKKAKALSYTFINNNFAGNAPETANLFKDEIGLEKKEWKDPGLNRFF